MFKSTNEIIDKFIVNDDDLQSDYLKRENSNFVYSLPLLRKNIHNKAEEAYLFEKILPKKLVELYKDGVIYIHDKQLSSYCQSVSCKAIAEFGIKSRAKNMLESTPASSFEIFIRHLSNIVILLSQQVSGAIMLAGMTTISASYLYEHELNGIKYTPKQIKKIIKSLIYELNLPLRSGSESPFSNITLEFGKPAGELKDDTVVIGGEIKDFKYSDIPSKYYDLINKAIIDVMKEGTPSGIPYTFPLITVQVDNNFDYNNNLFLYLLEHMYNWGGVYFENFRTEAFEDEYYLKLNPFIQAKDPEVSRSLCPLDPNQKVLYYNEPQRKFITSKISDVYKNLKKSNSSYKKILSNGKIVKAAINKFKADEFAEIKLINGISITTTLDHINKTWKSEEIKTRDLTTDDYLPISRKPLEGCGLTYDEGLLVGAFLGDGSYSDNNIIFSLNVDTDIDLINKIKNLTMNKFGGYTSEHLCTSSISGKQKCLNLKVVSKYLYGLINQFVKGNNALNKSLDLSSITKSVEFRNGIIDGFYQTDGGNNNRIYTSSKNLMESFTTLCASLGIPVRINEDNRENRLSKNTCYCIRLYRPDGLKTKYEGVYILDDDYFWFKIKEINKIKKKSNAYCFEIIDDNEPYFMLPNGILTHNCRLNISLKTLSKTGGGGIFGSSTGNVGAVQVLNLNMNRVLLEFGQDNLLLKEKIREYLEIMQEGHTAKRNFIESNKDLYPTFFTLNHNLKNYFNVFSITGMHEGLINIGYKDGMNDKEGKLFAHNLMQFITGIIENFIVKDNVACGIEYAPGENAAIKLARSDIKWAKKNNKEIFVQGTGEDVFLTSGCMLPFSENNFASQIENSAEFQGYATSGSILHHFIYEKVSPEILANHLKNLFKKPINYITFTPTMVTCMSCKTKYTEKNAPDKCEICDSKDLAYFSRVIGYVKMISRNEISNKDIFKGEYNFWSKARRIDWHERKRIKESDLID